MSRLRLLSRSVACAVILMSLSRLFYRSGGEFIAIPGIMFDLFSSLAVMLLRNSDDWPMYHNALPFNLVFYSTVIYFVSWLCLQFKKSWTSGSAIPGR